MAEHNEPLLKVEHLCQYFKKTKAVDDVSFEIKQGEVFGLVGESGCGKTTTGRAIIKIYDCTSGNVFFKGHRICAGTMSYVSAIKDIKRRMKTASDEEKKALREELRKYASEIEKAHHDQKHCDDDYAAERVKEIKQEYSEKLSKASGAEKAVLAKEYRSKLHIAKNSRLVTGIQMIFQDPIASLNPRMTVREIIAEGLIINGIKDKEYIDEQVYRILETVGLTREHAGRYPHEFSGGQRQRIGIARAVVMHPDMIIADEPVSALDVSIQAQVINLLNELRDQLGLTIMFIAHDLSVVKYFSDRIGVMYYGKMVELAPSDMLFAHPLHPYTKSLLSAIPLPDPRTEKTRKRVTYNAMAAHDYSKQQPTLRELEPGHFVLCNDEEAAVYMKELNI